MIFFFDFEFLIDVDMNVIVNWMVWDLFGIYLGYICDVGFDDCKR